MEKFKDLGKKPMHTESLAVPSQPSNEKYYPNLHIDGQVEIPGKVGSTINAEVKLKKTSETIRKGKDNVAEYSQSFDVIGINAGHAATDESELREEDHMDGGKVNAQSMIDEGLKSARLKNLEKARAAKGKK